MKTKKAPYDFKAGDEVWVCSCTPFIIIPILTHGRHRIERVTGDSAFLVGVGQFHRKTGYELMVPKDRMRRWIRPVTEQDREAEARADLIQVLRAVDWTKMPMEVLKAADAALPKPPTITVMDLQHWLDDGTIVNNRDGTVTMGVADFRRLVIEPAAKKARKENGR